MKKVSRKTPNKQELKAAIQRTFDDMMQEVMRGQVSVEQFASTLNQNYTQKKIELTGSLF